MLCQDYGIWKAFSNSQYFFNGTTVDCEIFALKIDLRYNNII